jgi:hypothetical protein
MHVECSLRVKGTTTEYTDNLTLREGETVSGQIEDDPLRRRTLDLLHQWVRQHDKLCHKQELELLGRHLYTLLFSPSVQDAFIRTYSRFEERRGDEESRLRLTLVFEDSGAIADYPWEFLFLPMRNEGKFLAGEITQLILTRFVPNVETQFVALAGPLRILVADCQPEDLPPIKSGAFLDALDKLGDRVVVTRLPNPTYADLEKAVAKPDAPVHVLHFIGHGKPQQLAMQKPKNAWLVEDAQARRVANETGADYAKPPGYTWIDDSALRALLEERPPRLVFLHACEGARGGSLENFRNTAQTLVYGKVSAVVAMQYPISNEDAAIFATTFYSQLAEGRCLDEAVAMGRRQLATARVGSTAQVGWDDRSFGTPVVYLQAHDAIVLPGPSVRDAQQPTEPLTVSAGPKRVPCPGRECPATVWPSQTKCENCQAPLEPCLGAGEPPRHVKVLGRECLFCRPQTQRAESRVMPLADAPTPVRTLSVGSRDVA